MLCFLLAWQSGNMAASVFGNMEELLRDYRDIRVTLEYYSDLVSGKDPLPEISAYGQFLRFSLEQADRRIRDSIDANPSVAVSFIWNAISESTEEEGNELFGRLYHFQIYRELVEYALAALKSRGKISGLSRAAMDSLDDLSGGKTLKMKHQPVQRIVKLCEASLFPRGSGVVPEEKKVSGTVKRNFSSCSPVSGQYSRLFMKDGILSRNELVLLVVLIPGTYTRTVLDMMETLLEQRVEAVFFAGIPDSGGYDALRTFAETGRPLSLAGMPEDGGLAAFRSEEHFFGGVRSGGAVTEAISGVKPMFYLPFSGLIPCGRAGRLLGRAGLIPVCWTDDSLDWTVLPAGQLTVSLEERLRGSRGGIVPVHTYNTRKDDFLRSLIVRLKALGYVFTDHRKLLDAYFQEH
ncbi:MAG: hypothetical protein PHQ23_03070 [Candidatus Wallbacteria bacterium]|nr:hypothetical protein [Candidatus Wallbacteria bacterium]